MVEAITVYKDSEGRKYDTIEEAEEADVKYQLDNLIKESGVNFYQNGIFIYRHALLELLTDKVFVSNVYKIICDGKEYYEQ